MRIQLISQAKWSTARIGKQWWVLLHGSPFGQRGYPRKADAEEQATWNAMRDLELWGGEYAS